MPVQLELVRIEEASRVDQIIANVIEDVAVVLIRARPQDHVHDAPGHAADLRGVTGDLHLEFLHGAHVGANLRGGPARIAVAEAVHIVVGGVGARAVDVQARALSALGLRHHAGNQEGQVGEIAPVERQVHNLLLDDHVAFDCAVLRIQRRDVGGHVHRLVHRAQAEGDVVSQRLADFEHDAGLRIRAEAFHFGSKLVVTGGEAGEREVSAGAGFHRPRGARLHVADADMNAGYEGLRRVGNDACNGRVLRQKAGWNRYEKAAYDRRFQRHDHPLCTRLPRRDSITTRAPLKGAQLLVVSCWLLAGIPASVRPTTNN